MKRVSCLILAMLLLLAVAGCGGSKPAAAPAAPAAPAASTEAKTEAPAAPADKNVTLKCGLTFKMDDYRGEDVQFWADRVKELSNGTVNIEIYPSETLVKGTESISSLVMGTIDMYLITTSYVDGIVKGIDALTLPCTAPVKTLEDRLILCRDIMYACEDYINDAFEEAGVHFIGTLCQGGYVDMVFSKPIYTADDYSGLKIRTTGGLNDQVLEAMGNSPTFISSSDLYLSLQTGVVDGAMSTPTTILNNKLYELCPYMVVPSLSSNYSPYFMCCSNEAWDSLSENQQSILVQAAKETLERTIEVYPERQSKDRETLIPLLKEYIELPDEEWAKILVKINPVYEQYAADFGPVDQEVYKIKMDIENAFGK